MSNIHLPSYAFVHFLYLTILKQQNERLAPLSLIHHGAARADQPRISKTNTTVSMSGVADSQVTIPVPPHLLVGCSPTALGKLSGAALWRHSSPRKLSAHLDKIIINPQTKACMWCRTWVGTLDNCFWVTSMQCTGGQTQSWLHWLPRQKVPGPLQSFFYLSSS